MLSKSQPSNDTVAIDINDLPFPIAIYIFSTNRVILNEPALELLGMKSNEAFDLATWNRINPFTKDILTKHGRGDVTDQKVQVMLFNGKLEVMRYSLGTVLSPLLGAVYIIYFSKVSDKSSAASFSFIHSIKDELAQLKPYLNRTGKTMHRALMKKYFGEENKQLTLNDLVAYEKELRIIQRAYPSLTHREEILCCLLVNDLDIYEIALATNRTPESVSVTIHRINKKLGFMNRKELINALKDLVRDENSGHDEDESVRDPDLE